MNNSIKNNRFFIKSTFILFVVLTAFSCGKKDEDAKPPEIENAFGTWEIISGHATYFEKNAKYVHINEDNTIDILSEDALGFKGDFSAIITVSDKQITISSYSSSIYNYILEEDKLTMTGGDGNTIVLKRNSIPDASVWVKELSILSEGAAPWDGNVDIAYNGTHIVYGKDRDSNRIGLVNTNNFILEGEIITSKSAYAVEVEKFDSPERYIFQSNNGHSSFYAYFEDTNTQSFESLNLGAWIKGLASIDDKTIWVSSGNEGQLYYYNYFNVPHQILQTIDVDFQPKGLDFQDGFLYVSDGIRIHKCQTTPTFRAIESYRIPNHRISGVAFDGVNFWFSTTDKLIKSNLTL